MKKLLGMLVLVGAVLAVAGTPAQAVLITNGATTIFGDDFESDTVGAVPPSPWQINTSLASDIVAVTNAATPGANQGSNYLEQYRAEGGVSQAKLYFASQTSGTVRVELGVYLVSGAHEGGDAVTGLYLLNAAGNGGVFMTLSENGAVEVYDGSAYNTIGTLSWSADIWHNVAIEYAPNATTATITIDGASATPNVWQCSEISFLMSHVASTETTTYLDAMVPEPATMSLLIFGGLGVLIRHRK